MFKVESQDQPEEGKRARYVYAPNSWSADRIRDGGMDPMTVIGVRPKGMFVGARGCPLDKKRTGCRHRISEILRPAVLM